MSAIRRPYKKRRRGAIDTNRICLHFLHSRKRTGYYFSLFPCVIQFVWFFLMSAEAQLNGDNSITVSTDDERMEYLTSSDSQDTLSIPSDSTICMKFCFMVDD